MGNDRSAIVVMLCARRKQHGAGQLRRSDGRKMMFVARPDLAPARADCSYARPDDPAGNELSWRQELLHYNQTPGDNPLNLLTAWQLYRPPIYQRLWRQYGPDDLYILSAGWGLIRADFLTPDYDITFSSAHRHQRRRWQDDYADWRMLPADTDRLVVFFGSKGYVRLFCKLTAGMAPGLRYVFYNANEKPAAPGCQLLKFDTRQKTNWYHTAARDFMDGRIGL